MAISVTNFVELGRPLTGGSNLLEMYPTDKLFAVLLDRGIIDGVAQNTAPNALANYVWADTSTAPATWKKWTGTGVVWAAMSGSDLAAIIVARGGGKTVQAVTAPLTGIGSTASPLALPAATSAVPGYMSAADKAKLDGLGGAASVSVAAPLTGNGLSDAPITVPVATTAASGLMSATDKMLFDNRLGLISRSINSAGVIVDVSQGSVVTLPITTPLAQFAHTHVITLTGYGLSAGQSINLVVDASIDGGANWNSSASVLAEGAGAVAVVSLPLSISINVSPSSAMPIAQLYDYSNDVTRTADSSNQVIARIRVVGGFGSFRTTSITVSRR